MAITEKSTTYGKHQADESLTLSLDAFDAKASTIGERLKEARKHLGLPQATLAKQANIPLQTYKKYEGGSISPGSDALLGLYGCGISIHWLLAGEGPMLTADTKQEPAPAVDTEMLEGVIEGLEKSLNKRRQVLAPDKKAHLIGVMYDYYRATGIGGAQGQGMALDRFLKLVT